MNSLPGNKSQTTGKVLIYICAFILTTSSALKFAHIPGVVAQMASMGIEGWKLTAVAALEALTVLVLLLPRTRLFGLFFASSYLGGAICAHLASNQPAELVPPAIILSLLWLGAHLRYASFAENADRFDSSPQSARQHDRQVAIPQA